MTTKNFGISNPLAVACSVSTLVGELRTRGLTLEVSSDMVAFNETKKLARGFEVAPMHHHEIGVFSHERAHWFNLRNGNGQCVGLQAFRCDEIDTTLADWCVNYMVGAYMRRQELMVPLYSKPPKGSISERLSGRLVYHGEFWMEKAYRDQDLIEHFLRVAIITSFIKWQPDAIWCLAGARIVERGHLSRSGYNVLEPGFMRWQLASDGIDAFENLYVLDRHSAEAMVEVWQSKAALCQPAQSHRQSLPAAPVVLPSGQGQSPGGTQTTSARHQA